MDCGGLHCGATKQHLSTVAEPATTVVISWSESVRPTPIGGKTARVVPAIIVITAKTNVLARQTRAALREFNVPRSARRIADLISRIIIHLAGDALDRDEEE